MTIKVLDFNYRGYHVNEMVCELPQLHEADDVFGERIGDYLMESMEAIFHSEEES